MTPLPDAARYFVALPDHAHKACTEADLRRLFEERVIKSDSLIAPVNTTDWRQLTSVFPDWTPLRPTGNTVEPLPVPLSEEPKQGPPFRPQYQNSLRLWGTILAFVAMGILLLSLSTCEKHLSTVYWSEGAVVMMEIAAVIGLAAIGLGIAGGAAARQEAMLAALNWMIAQRDEDTAKPSPIVPPAVK